MKKRFQIAFVVGLSILLAFAFWARFEKRAKARHQIQAATYVAAVFFFYPSLRLFMY